MVFFFVEVTFCFRIFFLIAIVGCLKCDHNFNEFFFLYFLLADTVLINMCMHKPHFSLFCLLENAHSVLQPRLATSSASLTLGILTKWRQATSRYRSRSCIY